MQRRNVPVHRLLRVTCNVTPETDHDLLVRIDTKLEGLRDTVGAFNLSSATDRRQLHEIKANSTVTEDHEKRLRLVERLMSIGFGIVLTVQLILGLLQYFRVSPK